MDKYTQSIFIPFAVGLQASLRIEMIKLHFLYTGLTLSIHFLKSKLAAVRYGGSLPMLRGTRGL